MDLIADSGLSSLLALIALAIMIAVLLLRSQRHFARRGGDAGPLVRAPRCEPDDSAPASHSPNETASWEVRMYDVARDVSGRLDSKMGALEQLIREADLAAARLEAALDRENGRTSQDPLGLSSSPDSEDRVRDIARPEHARSPGQVRRSEEIYTLADYGFAPAAIAQRTGMLVGEVELILGRRERR